MFTWGPENLKSVERLVNLGEKRLPSRGSKGRGPSGIQHGCVAAIDGRAASGGGSGWKPGQGNDSEGPQPNECICIQKKS